jgi:hypothetical protein
MHPLDPDSDALGVPGRLRLSTSRNLPLVLDTLKYAGRGVLAL